MTDNSASAPPDHSAIAERYLDLVKGCLTRELFADERWIELDAWEPNGLLAEPAAVRELLRAWDAKLIRRSTHEGWTEGHGLPATAETMVGAVRLDNVHELIRRVLDEGVPGDLVETGVWRGGVVAFMRAALEAYGDTARRVWACDSFDGLPVHAGRRFEQDRPVALERDGERFDRRLAIPLEEVQANLARYGLLDDRVRFVVGWFNETLHKVPIEQIAVLRLDGDLYESTWDALVALEPKVSPGGYVIIDDYSAFEVCRQAVDDYRRRDGITARIHEIDWTGVWWQKDA